LNDALKVYTHQSSSSGTDGGGQQDVKLVTTPTILEVESSNYGLRA